MYVILDWVANHTAWDHHWTETNPEFYETNEAGEFIPPVAHWTDVIALDFNNAEMRLVMTDALEYWVREFGIDGYRCDVAEEAGLDKMLLFFEKDVIEWRPHTERAHLTRLFQWKQRNQALWNGVHGGDFVNFATEIGEQVWAFHREKNGDKIIAILNLSPKSAASKALSLKQDQIGAAVL
jgi:glycosidase